MKLDGTFYTNKHTIISQDIHKTKHLFHILKLGRRSVKHERFCCCLLSAHVLRLGYMRRRCCGSTPHCVRAAMLRVLLHVV